MEFRVTRLMFCVLRLRDGEAPRRSQDLLLPSAAPNSPKGS